MTRILHVIQQLSRGGASRALLTAATHSARLGAFAHEVASLLPADHIAKSQALASGICVHDAPTHDALHTLVAASDIVHVHFWNTPELYAWLRVEQPAARVLIWCHVAGEHAPQVITHELLDYADVFLTTSSYTNDLPLL